MQPVTHCRCFSRWGGRSYWGVVVQSCRHIRSWMDGQMDIRACTWSPVPTQPSGVPQVGTPPPAVYSPGQGAAPAAEGVSHLAGVLDGHGPYVTPSVSPTTSCAIPPSRRVTSPAGPPCPPLSSHPVPSQPWGIHPGAGANPPVSLDGVPVLGDTRVPPLTPVPVLLPRPPRLGVRRAGWHRWGQGLDVGTAPACSLPRGGCFEAGRGTGTGRGTDTCHSRHHPPRPGVPTLQQGLVALGAPTWDSTQVGPPRQGQPVPHPGLSFGDIPHGSTHPLSPCPAGDPGSPRNSAGTTVPGWFVTRKETDLGGLGLVAAGSLSPVPLGHVGCPALSHRSPLLDQSLAPTGASGTALSPLSPQLGDTGGHVHGTRVTHWPSLPSTARWGLGSF